MIDKSIEYSDLFDRITVEKGQVLDRSFEEKILAVHRDDPTHDEHVRAIKCTQEICLLFFRGDRADQKVAYIKKQLEQDQRHKTMLEETQPRCDIPCLRCGTRMVFRFKDIDYLPNDKERVMIIYFCPNGCLPGRVFYNDGTEYIPKPSICEKCGKYMDDKKITKEEDRIVTILVCEFCGNQSEQILELSSKKEKVIDEQFISDRAKYVLNEKEYSDYLDQKDGIFLLTELSKKFEKQKEERQIEEIALKVRMIKVVELQSVITEVLEKTLFIKVTISDPTTDNGLVVKITAFDNDAARTDERSITDAKKAIETALNETNWRLVKGSINSTLGALSGELKGYTNETEVRRLVQSENMPKISHKTSKTPLK